MNSLINELRLSVGLGRLEHGCSIVCINKDGSLEDPLVGLERFAEAIVNECRKVITDFDGVEDYEYKLNPRSVRWDCSCELRDHFEIEEEGIE
jgi:hypothetical protein